MTRKARIRSNKEGTTEETREPQYNRCVELKNSFGLTSLGLMTNQVWYDDPRRLTFLLARYKFVAKMFSGRTNVGEVGCGDAFGTRVVLQEVPNVTVYDFDPVFIEDIHARQDARWPLKAEVHDIVASSLPRKHDALFSLDVIEHIAPSDEHAYLAHLAIRSPKTTAHHWHAVAGIAALCISSQQGRAYQLQNQRTAQSAAGEIFWPCIHVFHER